MRDKSNQKMTIDEAYSGFYTDDNEFCFQINYLSKELYFNPVAIFTSTLKTMNKICEEFDDDDLPTRDELLGLYYWALRAYFGDPASEKYIVMLDESEWKFWFIHVTTQLQKLQTSPKWKQYGKLDRNDNVMLVLCLSIFALSDDLKLSGRSLQVPKEFFHALASCIDILTPRLPNSDFVGRIVDICLGAFLLVDDSDGPNLKMIEKSGLLVQFLRCSTMPLDNMKDQEHTYSFYTELTKQLSFIQKNFKVGQPCGDMMHKILAGNDGHSNPNPKVLNFLRTISQLADKTHQDLTSLYYTKMVDCCFCRTIRPEHLMPFCSQCKIVSYCSKKCQKSDWQGHKKRCEYTSCVEKKNMDKYLEITDKFMTDYRDEISAKLDKTISETGYKMNELLLAIDFAANESGVVPALSNPQQFEIVSVANELQDVNEKSQKALSMINNLKENQMMCVSLSPIRAKVMIFNFDSFTKSK